MTIGVMLDGTGVTEAQYRQVVEQVTPSDHPTPGLRFHAAGKSDDGIVAFEIWESQEALGTSSTRNWERHCRPPASRPSHGSWRSSTPYRPELAYRGVPESASFA